MTTIYIGLAVIVVVIGMLAVAALRTERGHLSRTSSRPPIPTDTGGAPWWPWSSQ